MAGDGNGDVCVLITAGQLAGYVAFIDQSVYEAIDYVVVSNLWTFVQLLLLADAGERRWPFDPNYVPELDPAMAQVPASLQPWRGRP
jgi:hypothetical protein